MNDPRPDLRMIRIPIPRCMVSYTSRNVPLTWPWQAVFEWSNPTEENASISLGKVHTQGCNTKGFVASPRKLDWL